MKRKLITILTVTFFFSLTLVLAGVLSQHELTPTAQAKTAPRDGGGSCNLSNLKGKY